MKKTLLLLLILTGLSVNAQFWTVKSTGFATATRGLGSISIVDANNVWAIAVDGSGAGSLVVKEITRSADGGNTWTPTTVALGPGTAGLGLSSISAVSGTTAWISANPGTGNIGGVWKTVNSGAAFTKQATAAFTAASFTNFVYFWDGNNGIAQGDPDPTFFEIYTTTDGGTTWTRVPTGSIPATSPANNEFGYSNNYYTSGNTIWFGTSSGRLYRSVDKGLNWTVSQAPNVTDFGSATNGGAYAFSSPLNGLLVTKLNNKIYTTVDGGTTYTEIIGATGFFNGDIAYVPGTTNTYVTTGTTGSSYTLDGGLTWTNIDALQHTVVSFFDGNTGFTGGFTTSATVGGVSKYTGTVLKTDTFNASKFSTYPNPVSDNVTISNSDNILLTDVSITDINGRTVKTLKVNNLSEVQMNVAELGAGVYFMNITADTGKVVKKFIKN